MEKLFGLRTVAAQLMRIHFNHDYMDLRKCYGIQIVIKYFFFLAFSVYFSSFLLAFVPSKEEFKSSLARFSFPLGFCLLTYVIFLGLS